MKEGGFQPSIEVLKRLASELDVHVDALLSEEDDTTPSVTIQNMELTERVRMIDQLEPEDQQAIMRLIDSMLTKKRMQKMLAGSTTEG